MVQSSVDQAGHDRAGAARRSERTALGLAQVQSSVGGALVLNPLRSEEEAFRLLLYVIAVIALIIGIVLLLRAVL